MVDDLQSRTGQRSAAKRERIVDTAMRHFAEHGYQGARVEDIAGELGIAKGSVFQHFGSKAGLFFAAYRRAVASLRVARRASGGAGPGLLGHARVLARARKAPDQGGLGPLPRHLIGNYGTDLRLKREINRFLVSEDPYGTLDFVEYGVRRGEVRADLDVEMAASMIDWLAERLQDALVTAELDPGLFHRHANQQERRATGIEQFVDLLRRALGTAP